VLNNMQIIGNKASKMYFLFIKTFIPHLGCK
jgi:hypothetical protein